MYTCDECGGQGVIIVDISKGSVRSCPVCEGAGETES